MIQTKTIALVVLMAIAVVGAIGIGMGKQAYASCAHAGQNAGPPNNAGSNPADSCSHSDVGPNDRDSNGDTHSRHGTGRA